VEPGSCHSLARGDKTRAAQRMVHGRLCGGTVRGGALGSLRSRSSLRATRRHRTEAHGFALLAQRQRQPLTQPGLRSAAGSCGQHCPALPYVQASLRSACWADGQYSSTSGSALLALLELPQCSTMGWLAGPFDQVGYALRRQTRFRQR